MASFYTFLCLVLFQTLSTFAINIGTCRPPSEVLDELQNLYKLRLRGANITLDYNSDNLSAKSSPKNITEFVLSTASVSFKGHAMHKGDSAKPIYVNFSTKPIVIEHIQKGKEHNCRVKSSDNFDLSLHLENQSEEAAIILLAEYCLQKYLCGKFDSIITNDWLQKQLHKQREPYSKKSYRAKDDLVNRSARIHRNMIHNDSCSKHFDRIHTSQETINAMVDFGASVLISKIDVHKNGVLDIPDINEHFTVNLIWNSYGAFTARNGTFQGLKNIKRVENIVFTNENLRFSISSTYSLSSVELKFDYYEVEYGILRPISGELAVDIDKVMVTVTASFDYNSKPCKTTLDHLKIELGEINVHLTGLGLLNGQISSIISGLIRYKALDGIKPIAAQELEGLECEKLVH